MGPAGLPKGQEGAQEEKLWTVNVSVVHIISHTHDVYLYKSVKTPSCEGRVVHVKYE